MKKIDKKFIMQWLGLGLIVFALLFLPIIAVIPFLPISIQKKAVFISALAIGGQVITWAGVFLAGKEIVSRYKKYLDPRNWFRRSGEEKKKGEQNEKMSA